MGGDTPPIPLGVVFTTFSVLKFPPDTVYYANNKTSPLGRTNWGEPHINETHMRNLFISMVRLVQPVRLSPTCHYSTFSV